MSTKTTFKRVALVAVASLGFGLLSVVPSNAANVSVVVVSSAITNATQTGGAVTPINAGTAMTADLKVTLTGDLAIGDSGTATYAVAASTKAITANCTFTAAAVTGLTIAVSNATTGTFTYTATAAVTGAAITLGTASCPTTIGGLYTITSTGTITLVSLVAVTPTATAPGVLPATGAAYVTGLNVTQGLTRNTTAGTASVGGNATMVYYPKYHTVATAFTIKSSGVGSIVSAAAPAAGTRTYVNGVEATAGIILTSAAANASGDEQSLVLTSAVAGEQTITVTTTDATTGVSSTVATGTVTWGSVAGISAGFTSAGSWIGNGSVRPTATSYLTFTGSYPKTALVTLAAGATTGASIAINVFDAANVAMNGQAISATIEGPGLITLTTGNVAGATGLVRASSLTATDQAATHQSSLGITGDGTAGKATITVSSGTTVLFTKTVVFYGTVSKLVATQKLSVAKASSTSGGTLGSAVAAPAGTTVLTTPAVIISALDSNGYAVTGLTISAKSSDTTIIASGSVVESDGTAAGDGYAGAGSYNASVTSTVGGKSGSSTTVVFRTLLADGVTYVTSEPITFTLGGSISTGSVSAALDKASYAVGEAASLVLTVKDSSGNPVFDQDANLWAGLGTAPVWSKSVVGLTPSAAATTMIKSGKKTYTGYAPALEGDFKLTGALDALTVLSGAAVSASATVEGSIATTTASAAADAAAEATDAANAATDAANAAAEAADAATAAAQDAADAVAALSTSVTAMVADLRKQITSLTNLVIKIQKKVKA
jgi:trimeric autotransporter adhesin